jgi:hypothetical protein
VVEQRNKMWLVLLHKFRESKMRVRLLKTKSDKEKWILEVRRHDYDFDPDARVPCLVVWSDEEINGHNYTSYETFSIKELELYVDGLRPYDNNKVRNSHANTTM